MRALALLCVVWVGLLAITTYHRAQVWQSDLTLWRDAAARSPRKPRPFINLGLAHEQLSGNLPAAFQAQQTALALAVQPRLSLYQQRFSRIASLTNIARLLAVTGQEAAAERVLDDLVAQYPLFPHSRYNRGVLYVKTGRCAAGLRDLRIAIQLDSGLGAGQPLPVCGE